MSDPKFEHSASLSISVEGSKERFTVRDHPDVGDSVEIIAEIWDGATRSWKTDGYAMTVDLKMLDELRKAAEIVTKYST